MSTIFPLSASAGQEFQGYLFDGTRWNLIGGEFNPTSFSSNPPSNPSPGDLWVDSDSDVDILNDTNLVNQSDLDDYLTTLSASTTYITQASASDTYLDIISASTTYATKSSPSITGTLSIGTHGTIFDDGNLHIHTSDGVMWLNAADGGTAVKINTQGSGNGGLDVGGKVTSDNTGDTGWSNASLVNGFTSGGVTPGYRKLNSVVYLRGNITGSTGNTTAFTLPTGYRPATTFVIAVQHFGTADINYITINTDGTVVPNKSSSWLSGVCFPIG